VVDHITTHFAEEFTLEEAADMAGMSPTAFSRNFQKFTGSRFVEFVTKVRIGQACSMLQATDDKIATICHEVGFRNLANFNRHFLKVKDMTPSAYRDLTRSELAPVNGANHD
jgi:AraC-like DNA-binding protein